MIRHRRIESLLLALLLSATARGQQQTAGVDTTYHLHGIVLNALTGKPLPRALVTSGDRRLATLTGNEGQFAIDVSVPPRRQNTGGQRSGRFVGGLVAIEAQKPGYMAMRPALLSLDDATSSASVELKLMPAAIITGRVSSAATDSAANVRVTLMQHQVNDGDRTWIPINAQITDSRGEFRFTSLRPGEYTLVTAEWQGDRPAPRSRTEVTEQYSPVYYGDAHTLDAATKINLHYGDTLAAEFHLHIVPYYPVFIPVTGNNGQVSVQLNSFDGLQLSWNGRDSAVEGSLPSGDYNLALSSRGPDGQQSLVLFPLHVAGAPVHAASVELTTPGVIEVHVHTQFSKQENLTAPANIRLRTLSATNRGQAIQTTAPVVQINLRPEENRGGYSTAQPNAAGDLTLENVQPGRYFVHAQPFQGYVASLTRGGVDLLQHPLIVGSGGGGEPIEVTLRDDTSTLDGTVNYGSEPIQQSILMLLPLDASARFTQSFAGPDGKFTAQNLPPGAYRVLAFRLNGSFPQIPWHDAEAMRHYDPKGATVTVAPGQTQSIDVPVLDDTGRLDQ